MLGFLLIIIGLLFIALIIFVHHRCFPPKAQLVCDLWEMVESSAEN